MRFVRGGPKDSHWWDFKRAINRPNRIENWLRERWELTREGLTSCSNGTGRKNDDNKEKKQFDHRTFHTARIELTTWGQKKGTGGK